MVGWGSNYWQLPFLPELGNFPVKKFIFEGAET
jgi:hypothetical protein